MSQMVDPFILAATWHGDVAEAKRILELHPDVATANVYTGALAGNLPALAAQLDADVSLAKTVGGPYAATALTYLCMSVFLRSDKEREDEFVASAELLIKCGADVNQGFQSTGQWPDYETPLYGAAGIAHNERLTRLLLQHGADPNDGEAAYHCPESYDNGAMRAMVESGRMTKDSLTMMLIRKHDIHDYEGARYLLEHGADPNALEEKGWYPLMHALMRCNHIRMIELLLDHGTDPTLVHKGHTGIQLAVTEGRRDVLELFRSRGYRLEFQGFHELVYACAMGDQARARELATKDHLDQLRMFAGHLLAKFTSSGNLDGVKCMLSLGISADTPFAAGDGYFGIPRGSVPLHVACWRSQPAIVRLLIEQGADVNRVDANGSTPLMLAVRAATDSYWLDRRTPESVEALLAAGAHKYGVKLPTGYEAIDRLLSS